MTKGLGCVLNDTNTSAGVRMSTKIVVHYVLVLYFYCTYLYICSEYNFESLLHDSWIYYRRPFEGHGMTLNNRLLHNFSRHRLSVYLFITWYPPSTLPTELIAISPLSIFNFCQSNILVTPVQHHETPNKRILLPQHPMSLVTKR